jgi:peptidyl-prolyl cis-trans isomerase C
VEREIEEEILFRRGVALGLDRDDEIVRRRVVQKMQFLLHDVQAPAEPEEAELSAYFANNAERYATPPRVTFSHVYFATDEGAAREALHRLIGGAEASGLGEPFPDLYHFASYEPEQVHRLFGRTDFSNAVFSASPGQWVGPLRSGYGWHLIRVEARQAAGRPLFADVRDRVRTDYLLDEQARRNVAAFNDLAGEYEVVRTKL